MMPSRPAEKRNQVTEATALQVLGLIVAAAGLGWWLGVAIGVLAFGVGLLAIGVALER